MSILKKSSPTTNQELTIDQVESSFEAKKQALEIQEILKINRLEISKRTDVDLSFPETILSTDHWYSMMLEDFRNREQQQKIMLDLLKNEPPEMVSVTFERACNLQCSHCLYPKAASSEKISKENHLADRVLEAVNQLPGESPKLLHEGRILKNWHIDVLIAARKERPDLQIGLIDNGTFIKCQNKLDQTGFQFDWIDISLDGTEKVHNQQRNNPLAFSQAITGLKNARKNLTAKGRLSVLFTATSINHNNIEATADLLFVPGKELADTFQITTVSPIGAANEGIEQMDFSEFWKQCRSAYQKYGIGPAGQPRISIRFYRHHELLKIARVIGKEKLLTAFRDTARVVSGEISLVIDGIPVRYSPLSLWPQETFLIDSDASYRTAYSIGFSLKDLKTAKSEKGENLQAFTVENLKPGFDLKKLYRKCVDQWWQAKGQQYFQEEYDLFKDLLSST